MPIPERGTSAWLRQLAEEIWTRDYDLRAIGEVDRDNLTLGEMKQVDMLLAEIHAVSAPPAEGED